LALTVRGLTVREHACQAETVGSTGKTGVEADLAKSSRVSEGKIAETGIADISNTALKTVGDSTLNTNSTYKTVSWITNRAST